MRLSFLIAFATILCLCAPAQNSTAAQYDDQDAYAIYSRLLPGEQSYGFAKATIVIQQETTAPVKLHDYCLTPEAAREFKDAIEDYKRHAEPVLLQRRFEIDKPYELVTTETIGTLIKNYNWDDFYKRYPDSGGIIRMTAVGFNRQRTLAIVFTGFNATTCADDVPLFSLRNSTGNGSRCPVFDAPSLRELSRSRLATHGQSGGVDSIEYSLVSLRRY
ncbi:MAG: hypothetical protein WCB11_28520 [Terriglobales bacterium]